MKIEERGGWKMREREVIKGEWIREIELRRGNENE